MNRFFADDSLARREAVALRRFARRDPKAWLSLGLTLLILAGVSAVGVVGRDSSRAVPVAVIGFLISAVLYWAWWEWWIVRSVKRLVARQARPGTLLTASFGSDAVTMATPDIRYDVPYSSITHVVQIADVLVIKPNNHLVFALPMELVRPQDLALIRSRVHNQPMRKASLG